MKCSMDENFLRSIVFAINQAVSHDVPNELSEHRLETNNRIGLASGDFINENLKKYVVEPKVIELISFNRHSWNGRIIINYREKATVSICRERTLDTIKKKHGNTPHYLRTILSVENKELIGTPYQLYLTDMEPQYDAELIKNDYQQIMGYNVMMAENFMHFVIVYQTEHHHLTDIKALLLDKELAVVEEKSLMEFVAPIIDEEDLSAVSKIHNEIDIQKHVDRLNLVKIRIPVAQNETVE